MAVVKSIKQLAADVGKGDAFAAFLIAKRRRLDNIDQLVLVVCPMRTIDKDRFDTVADGWAIYRRYRSNDADRERLERLSAA